MPFSAEEIRKDFPIFLNRPGLVYLDSAASSQKPQAVIDRISHYYAYENANVHRGVYALAEEATVAYESGRKVVAKALGGVKEEEVIFTSGTTDANNIVAYSIGMERLKAGDEILIPVSEHHSNIVPWQIIAARTGAKVVYFGLNEDFTLNLEDFRQKLNHNTKIFACGYVSNVTGIIHPVKQMVTQAKELGAICLIDGAQAMPHKDVDVLDLGCDFFSFSAHKTLGPTGTGVLFGRLELLSEMAPFKGGGDMIERVTIEGSTWADAPARFEAGTPNVAGVVGMAAGLEYLLDVGRKEILDHERKLGIRLLNYLRDKPKIKCFVPHNHEHWTGIISFAHEDLHPHDIAAIADRSQVCVRAGHHCAQPLMKAFGVSATTRVSGYLYNTENDIESFISALEKAESLLT